MRFALWPNLTQAVGRRSGAPPLNTTVPAICEPRTHRLPTPAGPDPRPFSATFPAEATLPHHVVSYGPDIPNERAYRLLGNVEGKRVLELGCGGEQASIALAHRAADLSDADAKLSWTGRAGPQMAPNGVNGLPERTVGRTLTDPPSSFVGHQGPSGGQGVADSNPVSPTVKYF